MNERRSRARKVLDDPVNARTRTTATIQILDISLGGMRVLSEEPLPPQKQVVTWLPTRKGEIRLRANVLRCRAKFLDTPTPSGAVLVYEAGLAFTELGTEEQKLLNETYLDPGCAGTGEDMGALIALTQAINGTAQTA